MNNKFTAVEIQARTDAELEEKAEEKIHIPWDWNPVVMMVIFGMALYAFASTIYYNNQIDKLRPLVYQVDRDTRKLYDHLHLERERLNSEIIGGK
jgi:hypothetical protein